jgi:hypothetical protein
MVVVFQAWAMAASATLSVPEVTMPEQGDTLTVPVYLDVKPDQQVAGLQFELEYAPEALEVAKTDAVFEGAVAKAAEKKVSYSLLSPGKVCVLIVGVNKNVLSNGEIATIQFTIRRDRAKPLEPLRLANATLANLSGVQVSDAMRNGAVRFPHAAAANPPEDRSSGDSGGLKVAAALALMVAIVAAAGVYLWKRKGAQPPSNRRNGGHKP